MGNMCKNLQLSEGVCWVLNRKDTIIWIILLHSLQIMFSKVENIRLKKVTDFPGGVLYNFNHFWWKIYPRKILQRWNFWKSWTFWAGRENVKSRVKSNGNEPYVSWNPFIQTLELNFMSIPIQRVIMIHWMRVDSTVDSASINYVIWCFSTGSKLKDLLHLLWKSQPSTSIDLIHCRAFD